MKTAKAIVEELDSLGRKGWVTISGGEPALQIDKNLIDALHDADYLVAIETNGTKQVKATVDYLTLSPKLPREQTVIEDCDTLKLLYPHPNPLIRPEFFESIKAQDRYLQPIDTGDAKNNQINIQRTIDKLYTLNGWRLSLQTHKYVGVE